MLSGCGRGRARADEASSEGRGAAEGSRNGRGLEGAPADVRRGFVRNAGMVLGLGWRADGEDRLWRELRPRMTPPAPAPAPNPAGKHQPSQTEQKSARRYTAPPHHLRQRVTLAEPKLHLRLAVTPRTAARAPAFAPPPKVPHHRPPTSQLAAKFTSCAFCPSAPFTTRRKCCRSDNAFSRHRKHAGPGLIPEVAQGQPRRVID